MDSSAISILYAAADTKFLVRLCSRLDRVYRGRYEIIRTAEFERIYALAQSKSFDLCVLDLDWFELDEPTQVAEALAIPLFAFISNASRQPRYDSSLWRPEFYLCKEAEDKDIDSLLRFAASTCGLRRDLKRRHAREKLLDSFVFRFVNMDSTAVDQAVERTLEEVVNFIGADRSYVCQFSASRNQISSTHEWCGENIPSQKRRVINSPLSRFRWFSEQICARRPVVLHSLSELPDEAVEERKELQYQGVRSLLCVPLARKGQAIGFLGLSAVRSETNWASEDIDLLLLTGRILVGALKRRQAEEALQESEVRFRNVLDSMNDGLVISGTDGTIDYVNSRFTELTGFVSDEVLGRNETDILSKYGTLKSVWSEDPTKDECEEREPGTRYELEIPKEGGKRQWLEVKAGPFIDENGKQAGCVRSLADITSRKELENRLLHSQKMEAVGRLAGGVAHDFNNLLTAMLGYSGILLNRLPDETPIRREILQIRKASEQASSLVQQLLTFSRKQIVEPAVLDANSLVEDTSNMLVRLIGEDVELNVETRSEHSAVRIDPSQMQQVIVNLAINARDAMPEGGVLSIRTKDIVVKEQLADRQKLPQGRYVLISISDTGCGMDENVRQHLFEPFFTTKEPGKGTGLGLSTVYGIVRQIGGAIEVDSTVGSGSTFNVYLPHHCASTVVELPIMSHKALSEGTETILLVEDEDTVRSLLKEVLEMAGYTVLAARHGRQALRIAERYRGGVDLVVTDVVMPFLGGKQLIERLRCLRPNLKVLIISGYLNQSVSEESGVGVYPFLSKPFSPYEFSKKLRAILDVEETEDSRVVSPMAIAASQEIIQAK